MQPGISLVPGLGCRLRHRRRWEPGPISNAGYGNALVTADAPVPTIEISCKAEGSSPQHWRCSVDESSYRVTDGSLPPGLCLRGGPLRCAGDHWVVAFCNRRSTWASRRKPIRVTESPRLWCCSLHDNLETKKIPRLVSQWTAGAGTLPHFATTASRPTRTWAGGGDVTSQNDR